MYYLPNPSQLKVYTFNSFFLSPFPKLKWYKIDTYNSAETAITGGTDYILRRFNQYLIIKISLLTRPANINVWLQTK